MSIINGAGHGVNSQFTRNLWVFLRLLALAIVGAIFILLPFAAFPLHTQRAKRYLVPGIPDDKPQRTAAFGYFDTGILRSVRTSDGRRYEDDEIAFLIRILDEAEQDGFDDLEVVVSYRKTQTQVTYATTIDYLREHGRRVLGVSGWELSMPRYLWLADGQPQPQPQPKRQPETEAQQAALFVFAEPRRIGGY
jgi:hypothetical protein